ncbi:MAG: TlpA disulfide reductase family protein [Deinococcales bacterium]|jgi:thiol-disulfide isomerase/thioredoxin
MRESGRGAVPWWSWVLVAAAVAVLGGGAVFFVVTKEHGGSARAKTVQMSSVDYRSVVVGPVSYLDLHHDYLHKVVVVTYVSSGCAACRSEVPELVKTYGRFKDRGVQFIGVSLEASRAATRAMIAKLGIDYPVYLDSDGQAARQRFHVQDVPATLVYRKGRLLKRFGGALSGSELSAYLATLTGTSDG